MINTQYYYIKPNTNSQTAQNPFKGQLPSVKQNKYPLTEDTVSFCARKTTADKNSKRELNTHEHDLNEMKAFLGEISSIRYANLTQQQKDRLKQLDKKLEEKEIYLEKIARSQKKAVILEKLEPKLETVKKLREARNNLAQQIKKDKIKLTAQVDLTYKNMLNLKSEPESDFRKNLAGVPGIKTFNRDNAESRISSLSKYLKEKMVGFEVPEYEFDPASDGVKREKRGGYQWFERGLQNLLIGSKKADLQPEEYKDTAQELFGLLSLHDKYWKSHEFSDYLASLKASKTINKDQTKAVNATIEAIKELQKVNRAKRIHFGAKKIVKMPERTFTPMKRMPEILKNCAYTGVHLSYFSKTDDAKISTDHIIPHSWENSKNDDGNFLITTAEANDNRGTLPLLAYLKGESSH